MKLNSKLTGGLAWAGLIVILAVPSADMLTKPKDATPAHITSDMDAIRTASIADEADTQAPVRQVGPAAEVAATGPADTKTLPSYISDAPAELASAEPATNYRLVVPDGQAEEREAATDVAKLEDTTPLVAPVPYPATMRPTAPVVTASVDPAGADEPLIIDEDLVARRDAAVARVLDDDFEDTPRRVSGDQLEEWDSGSLADYLERRGLMSEDEAQQANYDDFDEDGFFLDEGPNRDDRRLVRRVRPGEFFFF